MSSNAEMEAKCLLTKNRASKSSSWRFIGDYPSHQSSRLTKLFSFIFKTLERGCMMQLASAINERIMVKVTAKPLSLLKPECSIVTLQMLKINLRSQLPFRPKLIVPKCMSIIKSHLHPMNWSFYFIVSKWDFQFKIHFRHFFKVFAVRTKF